MKRFRFHIGSLVLLVLLLGIGFAALRESSDLWESGLFTLTLGVLLISILLAVYRTESRRAFWIGFGVFGWTYLGLTLVPSIESRLLTTKGLAFINSKIPRSIPNGVGLAYEYYDNDGDMDLYFVKNSRRIALYRNQGNGAFQDVTRTVGLDYGTNNDTISLNIPSRLWLRGSAENFMRIGHSLFALIAAFVGGHLSRHLYAKNRQAVQATQSHASGG